MLTVFSNTEYPESERHLVYLKTERDRSEERRLVSDGNKSKKGPFAYVATQGSTYPSIRVFAECATER
jgi:hypothetical protein